MLAHPAHYLTPAAACLVAACATVAQAPVNDATLTLQPRQTVPLGPMLSLRYERAADSRCPSNARCVWAGGLVYHFTLTGKTATEPFLLDAARSTFASKAFDGVQVVLAATEPPPRGTTHEEPPPHPVTVTVSVANPPCAGYAAIRPAGNAGGACTIIPLRNAAMTAVTPTPMTIAMTGTSTGDPRNDAKYATPADSTRPSAAK